MLWLLDCTVVSGSVLEEAHLGLQYIHENIGYYKDDLLDCGVSGNRLLS